MSGTITPMWTLGDRIRKARESSGLKQTDLAAKIRVARSTIAGWENGVHRPSYSDLEAIARACDNLSVDWLETGTAASTVTRDLSCGQDRPRWYDQPLFPVAA